jgi:hypothetical protein
MTTITLDERGCGQGKTTDGIYKRLNKNHKNNIKSLIVVPSIELQKQYKNDLDIPVHIINSKIYNQYTTTVRATLDSMERGTKVILITHKTFLMLPFNKFRKDYDLVIDEAIEEVIKKTSIVSVNTDDWNPDYDLNNLFSFKDDMISQIVELSYDDDDNWYELHQDRTPSYSLISDSPSFKTITDKNYIHYVTPKGWNILNNQDGGVVNVISTLNPESFKYWKSIHIAAAAFKRTKMYHWMQANSLFTQTQNSFKKHKGNIKIWASDNNKFNWSNNKRKNMPEILNDYHTLVNTNASGKVIAIRNNEELRSLNNEERIGHSVHGLNSKVLQSCNDISLESALIMDSQTRKFVMDNWFSAILSKSEVNRNIIHMHSAYLFYQVVMRTKLRNQNYNDERINIFVLDQDTAVCLMDYFEEISDVGEMDITSNIIQMPRGRPQTSEELKIEKKAERNRKYRLKQMAKRNAEDMRKTVKPL